MQTPHPPTFRGRTLGFTFFIALQVLVGSIHVFFGLWFLSSTTQAAPFNLSELNTPLIYGAYTVAFGLFTLLFTAALWTKKTVGLIGTIAVSVFVVVADSLTLLDLPSVPGIPKFAGGTEIIYSLIVIIYLLSTKIKKK